jgi:hypothetical protein
MELIEGAADNTLCSEGNENAAHYTLSTRELISAEIERRGLVDCSSGARLQRDAAGVSSDQLCAIEILAIARSAPGAAYARAELEKRQFSCDQQKTQMIVQAYQADEQKQIADTQARAQQAQAQAAQQQSANQALINGLFMMQALQAPKAVAPIYPLAPQSVHCTSMAMGNAVNTNCR